MTGRLRNARHWDWLGQALEAGFLRGQPPDKGTAPSKEQLLLERRQKIQGNMEPQVSPYMDKIIFTVENINGKYDVPRKYTGWLQKNGPPSDEIVEYVVYFNFSAFVKEKPTMKGQNKHFLTT